MLFRILQESLCNIARHAHASEVGVELHRCGSMLTLSVQDNGVGMPAIMPTHGMGLPGIRQRVAAIGGSLVIDSGPGRGTVLTLSFPALQTLAVHG